MYSRKQMFEGQQSRKSPEPASKSPFGGFTQTSDVNPGAAKDTLPHEELVSEPKVPQLTGPNNDPSFDNSAFATPRGKKERLQENLLNANAGTGVLPPTRNPEV